MTSRSDNHSLRLVAGFAVARLLVSILARLAQGCTGMAFDQKNMTGALFKNDKQGNDKRPDYRGTALIDGVKYTVSAWIKKSQAGAAYMSMGYQKDEGGQR